MDVRNAAIYLVVLMAGHAKAKSPAIGEIGSMPEVIGTMAFIGVIVTTWLHTRSTNGRDKNR